MTDHIEWEHAADYVSCCYGDGSDPGDCYTRVGQGADGAWWVDDGDDHERSVRGPYATEDDAYEAALALAAEQDEGDGQDADAVATAALVARAGAPDPDGEWCVIWATVGDDAHTVARYATEDAAEAAAELRQAELVARHPGARLLCGYEVRRT